jgi:hypothetical protein
LIELDGELEENGVIFLQIADWQSDGVVAAKIWEEGCKRWGTLIG